MTHNSKMNFTTLIISKIVKVTQRAVLVELSDQHENIKIWIPRSNLSYSDDKLLDKTHDISQLNVADWWLKENQL